MVPFVLQVQNFHFSLLLPNIRIFLLSVYHLQNALDQACGLRRDGNVIGSVDVDKFQKFLLASCVWPTSLWNHIVCGTTPSFTSERYRFNRGMLLPDVPHQIRPSLSNRSKLVFDTRQYIPLPGPEII